MSSSAACDNRSAAGTRRRRRTTATAEIPPPLDFAICRFGIQGPMSSCPSFEAAPTLGLSKAEAHRRRRRTACGRKAMAVALEPAKELAENKKRQMKQRRVVVTGMGVVTPLGHDPDIFYNNLLEGVSGVREIKSFSAAGWVAPKLAKRMDKFMLYLLTAGKKALEDGGVTEEVMSQFEKTRCGVLIGSAMGGIKVRVSSAYSNREALTLALEPSCFRLRIHLTFSMT
ncbi:hypothetical protein BHM03_00004295 [Ensete ventricosum]|uniref:beta-ketoacyl-[acyl-carrier-protein] synthase I n=1 Tax=Ensete ventricosum TaxID=4639 RepID=A0A445MAJ4_ENSVE|nr:hypothetical protein BHM03_00004295 [Ensete ventricosum]